MSDIRDYTGEAGQAMDLGDTIVHVCPCGCNVFRIFATFEDYELATYMTDAECVECNSRFKCPTPIDKPGYKPDSLSF